MRVCTFLISGLLELMVVLEGSPYHSKIMAGRVVMKMIAGMSAVVAAFVVVTVAPLVAVEVVRVASGVALPLVMAEVDEAEAARVA